MQSSLPGVRMLQSTSCAGHGGPKVEFHPQQPLLSLFGLPCKPAVVQTKFLGACWGQHPTGNTSAHLLGWEIQDGNQAQLSQGRSPPKSTCLMVFHRIIAGELGDIFLPLLSLECNCCSALFGFFFQSCCLGASFA